MKCLIAMTIPVLLLSACASSPSATSPKTVTLATGDREAAMLGRIKALEGEWTMDRNGQKVVAAVFKVSSAGSVVKETMFPGSDHEMTNVYHMDGPDLIMTHYCAGGNQPRMRCVKAEGNSFPMRFDGSTNLGGTDKAYMAEMTLTIKDADHISEGWQSYKAGQACTDSPVFELTRKR